ncbi:MAG: response regulator [Gammaproteobacteria bacterium]|jgi:signal transduction histidine kinase/HPt (histidine-containing phosphotransfer) domain-containing protein|nr:response regulator [Gammaproteobacteria bacterium]MBT4606320.1 response regulator [Thiotrichales bacterium]MBT3473731.1 response regulator [Gammaproteobacteria bacterium]MBT3968446.1 response regulator [Gammaproteobacteria bacterium]MBT4081748.1 response regulator [Gammaproteobacteria bacterium]
MTTVENSPAAIRILAIDDDQSVLDSYNILFGGGGGKRKRNDLDELTGLISSSTESTTKGGGVIDFELDRVTSGEKGLERVKEGGYGVILLDMRMPGGWDGMETARRIREVDTLVRIILITAFMDHTLEELREAIGVNFAYIQKPFDRNELVQLVLLLGNDWKREQQLIEAEKVMADAAREAERANKAKDDFLASMSHELRTPLTSLLGNCELMSEGELDGAQQGLLTSMEVSGKSLLYLINDILDSSKIEAGLFDIDEVEYNPIQLIEELRLIFSSRAAESGIRFNIYSEVTFSHLLLGDGRRLSQVLINLLSNAVKFTEEGEVSLSVQFDDSRKQVRFTVADSGIGMNDEALSKIFKPFEQANRSISGRFGGTGLGLHISWNLTKLMGGTIDVSSEEGKGSSFIVELPLREGGVLQQTELEQRKQQAPLNLSGRVLIAEDTPELQVLERRMVEAYGVSVEVVNNGQKAVEQVLKHEYDLVLMDMQMPVMGGIEATQQLRKLNVSVPIVALTANVMQKQREQFFAAGCDGFLSKPIDRSSLRTILQQYLSESVEPAALASQSAEPAAVVSPPPAEPVARVDPMIDDELMALFRDRSAILRKELMAAFESADWKQVSHAAHTIKGSGASFGFPQLTDLGRQIQDGITAGKFEEVAPIVEQLNSEMLNI